MLDFLEVQHEFVDPEGRAFADGRRLRGLEMREAESRLILLLVREFCDRGDDVHELPVDEGEGLLH